MQTWMLFYMGGGFLLAAFALPLVRHKINPKGLVILPPKGKLEDKELWYQANEFVGRRLVTVGIGTALTALFLYLWPGLGLSEQNYILSVTAVVIGLLLWAILASYVHVKSM